MRDVASFQDACLTSKAGLLGLTFLAPPVTGAHLRRLVIIMLERYFCLAINSYVDGITDTIRTQYADVYENGTGTGNGVPLVMRSFVWLTDQELLLGCF